jgi:general secretion pathway protein M
MNAPSTARRRPGTGPTALSGWFEGWARWWSGLQERERRLLGIGALSVVATLLWLVAIQPPLKLLSLAPTRLDAMDAQLLTMRRLAVEARELRTAPQVSAAESVAALRTASARLEPAARLSIQGDRAVLTLDGLSGEMLRAWLAEARSGARARPVEAQLTRSPRGFTGTITLTIGGSP